MPAAGDSHEARFRLCQAATVALGELVEEAGLLIVLDDLHWADPASLQLLETVTGALADRPILTVALFRDDEARDERPLAQTLPVLARRPASERIALGGLTAGDVGAFISTHTGRHDVPPATVAAVHQRTEGNPFFVKELVRLLESEGALHDPAAGRTRVPAGVRDVIRRRLSRLPADVNGLLAVAAVIGTEFDLPTLESAADLPADAVLDALEPALSDRIVVERRHGALGYRFSHALVHETVYERTGASLRARLHARVGELLAARRAGHDAQALEVAHHYLLAVDVVGPEAALPAVLRAVEVATAQLGYEQAEQLLDRALSLLYLVPHSDERDRTELWIQARLGMAAADRGPAAPATAAAWARTRELGASAPVPHEQLATLFGQYLGAWMTGDTRAAVMLSAELLEVAHASQDPRLLFAAGFAHGMTELLQGRVATARRHLEEAVVIADSLRDSRLDEALQGNPRATSRCVCAIALALTDERERAMATGREAVAIARATGHQYSIDLAGAQSIWAAVVLRDVEAAGRLADRAVADGAAHNYPNIVINSQLYRAWAIAMQDDTSAALALLDQNLRDSQGPGVRALQSLYLCTAAEIQHRGGRHEAALSTIDEGLAWIEGSGERLYEAELHRLRGELLRAGSPTAAHDSFLRAI